MNHSATALEDFAARCFEAAGMQAAQAREVAANLVLADLRGVASHGVTRIPIYAERLLCGVVNPQPNMSVLFDAGALVLVDGDNGPGAVVSNYANRIAIGKARELGACVVAVKASNHNGICSAYTMDAAREGMIGIAATNAAKSMAIAGGREPLVGTNPISIAVPRKGQAPVVLDMATAVVARGKIVEMAKRGETIPEGWALDKDGNPTTSAQEAERGVILPFSGAKGSGLAIMIEMLCGVLSGGPLGPLIPNLYSDFKNPQGIGHFFVVIDPSRMPVDKAFGTQAGDLSALLKQGLPQAGVKEVLTPGEPEDRLEAQRRKDGIALPPNVEAELNEMAQKLKVTPLGQALAVAA